MATQATLGCRHYSSFDDLVAIGALTKHGRGRSHLARKAIRIVREVVRLPFAGSGLESITVKRPLSINRALALSACTLMLAGQLMASITCLSVCSFQTADVSVSDSAPCGSCCNVPAPNTAATASPLSPCEDCPMPCCVNTGGEQWNAARQSHRFAGPAFATPPAALPWAAQQQTLQIGLQSLPPASAPPPLYRMHCALLT